jgi:hypothetical protein
MLGSRFFAAGLSIVALTASAFGCAMGAPGVTGTTGSGGMTSSTATTGSGGTTSTSGTTSTGGTSTGGMDAGTGDGGLDGGMCSFDKKPCNGTCVALNDPQFGCGVTGCAPCNLNHATAQCVSTSCYIAVCATGFGDCNFDPTDGCETDLTTPMSCGACYNSCAAPDQCHTLGACNPATMACAQMPKANGTACNDGDTCTQTDTCQGGVCTGTNPAPDGTACSNLGTCLVSGACAAGVCKGTPCASGLCGTSLSAFKGSQTPSWNLNGSAKYDAVANTVVLAPGTANGQAGTAIYKDPITVDAFTVTFDFKLSTTAGYTRADGIVFVIETDGPTALGSAYGGFGVLGLHGYAVELDIFDSGPCDPGNGNHAGIDVLSACSTNTGILSPIATSGDLYDNNLDAGSDHGVGDIGDGGWRTATIQLANGAMSVSVTDPTTTMPVAVPGLQGVSLTGFTPGTPYYFGFGAGTGSNNLAARQEIRNVQVTFPSERCL